MQEFLRPLTPAAYQIFDGAIEARDSVSILPMQNWLLRGAIREDDIGSIGKIFFSNGINCLPQLMVSDQGDDPRSVNHFYDPFLNQGLVATVLGHVGRFKKSTDWAMGNIDSFANPTVEDVGRENHYSYRDARDAMWIALTGERNNKSRIGQPYTAALREADSEGRMTAWATVFRSLGNVMHLLQDTGQPQHTRNDSHSGFNTSIQKSFEDYTNDRVLGVTADAGEYVRRFFSALPDSFTAPPLGSYPTVRMTAPLRFFTTRGDGLDVPYRLGLADYTNRGFFTGGTLGSYDPDNLAFDRLLPDAEPYPPSPSAGNGYTVVDVPCRGFLDADPRLRAVTCSHYTHSVPDNIAPDYAYNPNSFDRDVLPDGFTLPNVPLASASIFRNIFFDFPNDKIVDTSMIALSREDIDAIGDLVIPRAVAYSTGLLNFFFRGGLEVLAPNDGVVSILNHGVPHHAQDGYPIKDNTTFAVFGFEKVRLRVRNTTPAITESGTGRLVPQVAGNGDINARLVAVARFHRNPCYQPDLSGEVASTRDGNVMQNGCAAPPFATASDIRTTYPEIVVSKAFIASNGIPSDSPQDITFDFSEDPIPADSTLKCNTC